MITSLRPGVTYYFRIWTRDENPTGWSDISNAATSWAQIVVLSVRVLEPTTYYFGILPTDISTVSVSGIVVRNDGNVRERYLLHLTTGPPNTIWNTGTTAGHDRFVLYTVARSFQPPHTAFGESAGNDILTLTSIAASATNFCVDGETPTAINRAPYPIITNTLLTDCTFWFRLRTLVATSTLAEQRIPVIITAVEQE